MAKASVPIDDILALVAAGLSQKQISDKLGMRQDTLCHRLRRFRPVRNEPDTTPGFVRYWRARGLSDEAIVEKVRPVRGW